MGTWLFLCDGCCNGAAIKIGVHVSLGIKFSFFFSGYMHRNVIAGSYDNPIFSFLRTLHFVFHSDCTNSHFHKQCISVPFSLHPLCHLLFVEFFIVAILTSVR